MNEETLEALLTVINYLEDEQKDYEERCEGMKDDHIYLSVKLLEDWLYTQQPTASRLVEKYNQKLRQQFGLTQQQFNQLREVRRLADLRIR